MNSPEMAKTPGGSSAPGKENVANGHKEGEVGNNNNNNPFADYMWMENEEDYNRQVSDLGPLFMYMHTYVCTQVHTHTDTVIDRGTPTQMYRPHTHTKR